MRKNLLELSELIILLAGLAFLLRLLIVIRDSVPFAYDMGRDLLWAKDIVFYKEPTLIGPAASIWGVYFGPLWYYFLSIPLFLSNGHPLSAVITVSLSLSLTGFLAYCWFHKYLSRFYALIFSIIILFSSQMINLSLFAFPANITPILTLCMIYFLFLAVTKNPLFISASFLSVSLIYHTEPPSAVVFTFIPIFIFFYFKLYRTRKLFKIAAISFFAYVLPFTPQILFELRNNFIQTRSLLAYFAGNNPSLSGQLPFLPRILDRAGIFFELFKESVSPQSNIIALLILLLIGFGLYHFIKTDRDKNLHILLKINVVSLLIIFIVFSVFITVEIKTWYLYGTFIFVAFLIVYALVGIRNKAAAVVFVVLFLGLNIFPYAKDERTANAKNDPAQLSNQLAAIEYIYDDSQGKPFSVYVYTPPIYDFSYQYLFWWQGVRFKKGLPVDFAYLPNQPRYVRNKELYSNGKIASTIYLILENSEQNEFYTKDSWLKNFDSYKLTKEIDINGAITVRKLNGI